MYVLERVQHRVPEEALRVSASACGPLCPTAPHAPLPILSGLWAALALPSQPACPDLPTRSPSLAGGEVAIPLQAFAATWWVWPELRGPIRFLGTG